jgi:hypothetical protein
MNRYSWIVAILLCCAMTAVALAYEPILNVSMVAAGQDGPLEIIGFRPSETGQTALELRVRNVSSKATRDYWVEPEVRNPAGQIWNFTNSHAATSPGLGTVQPGADKWDSTTNALNVQLVMFAKDLHSTCLRITPVIISVDFEDGTSWNVTPQQKADAIRRADLKSNPPCTESPTGKDYLVRTDPTKGFAPKRNLFDSYQPEDSGEWQSFSFSCVLHRIDDTTVRPICGAHTPSQAAP